MRRLYKGVVGLVTCAAAVDASAADMPSFQGAPPSSRALVGGSAFAGAYVAGGGSFGWSTTQRFNVGGFALDENHPYQGWSGQVAAGYNATFGAFVLGTEISGRFGDERASGAEAVSGQLVAVSGIGRYAFTSKSDWSAHLSIRAGLTAGNTLVFTKLGFGAAHFTDQFTSDETALNTCISFPCSVGSKGVLRTAQLTTWGPSVLAGVGLEQNFGTVFVRIEAEMEAVPLSSRTLGGSPFYAGVGHDVGDTLWTGRAVAALGLRF